MCEFQRCLVKSRGRSNHLYLMVEPLTPQQLIMTFRQVGVNGTARAVIGWRPGWLLAMMDGMEKWPGPLTVASGMSPVGGG